MSKIKIYNSGYKGDCPLESAELKTFFNQIRLQYPDTWGRLAFHPRNEGKKSHSLAAVERMEGKTKGVADIIIPPGFVCELKRQDKSKSKLPKDEQDYLEAAANAGCFVCVAYGWEQAWRAFIDWSLTQ